MGRSVYLIAIFNADVTELVGAEIWSSPEWHQSMQLPDRKTFVAWEIKRGDFHESRNIMIELISDSKHRHHYLFQKMIENERDEMIKAGLEPLDHIVYANIGYKPKEG